MKPNLLVVGAARSGTTALLRALSLHQDVFVCSPKEPHFLAFANTDQRFCGPGDDEMINRDIVRDAESYQRLFEKAERARVRADGSVSSLYYSEASVPNTVQHAASDVKIVALLRDPVQRAYSSYLYLRSRGHEPLTDFRDALAAEGERRGAGWHHMWHYTNMGFYGRQLSPFIDQFGLDRVMVLDHEEFTSSPDVTLSKLFRFLSLESIEVGAIPETNRSGEPTNRFLSALQQTARRNASVKRGLVRAVPFSVRERLRSANLHRPALDPGVADELRQIYVEDQKLLSDLAMRSAT